MKKKLMIGLGLAVVAVGAYFIFRQKQTIPKGAKAVSPFDAKRYMGRWYEIARIDFKHERDLNNVTADYSLNENGTIKVVNRGYNYKTGEEKMAEGKGKFVDSPNEARLKVSFFGPFYSGYNVLEIDRDYKYALVAGEDLDYLWLLSREKTMPEFVKEQYLDKAREIGYDVSRLTWVEHNK